MHIGKGIGKDDITDKIRREETKNNKSTNGVNMNTENLTKIYGSILNK